MADNATFRLVLDDQVSGPAQTAADRMERLKGTIEGGRKELSTLQASMRDMKRSGSVSDEVISTHQERIDSLRKRLGEANAEYLELGGTFRKSKPPSREIGGLSDAMGKLGMNTGGPLGRLQSMGRYFKSGAGRALLMKAAVIALGVAFVAAAVALTKYSIAQSDAARSERLRFEALAHLRGRSRQAISDSEGLQNAIDKAAAASGAARAEVSGYGEAAYRAGLRGKALEEAVRGASVKGAALGERYGKSFVFMAASAARAGKDISKMSDDAEERFGGLAQRRMMSMGNVARRMSENISGLFSGVNIEPMLKSLSRFVQLFTKTNEVGREATGWIGPVFGGIVSGIAKAVDAMTWVVEAWTLGWVKLQNIVKAGVSASIDMLFWLEDRWKSLISFFDGIELPGWMKTAAEMAHGLASGLAGQMAEAHKAGRNLADSVAKGFRDRAEIKSPSRLFASYGDDVTEGFAMGVERSAPEAHDALGELVAPPDFPAAPATDGSSAMGMGGVTINVSVGDIYTQATDGEGVLESFRLRLGEVLQGVVTQEGLA